MNKKTLLLGGILVVLIILAYAYQGPLKKWRENLGKPNNFLSKVDVGTIGKIEITKNGKTTTIEKQGEKWKVGGTKDFYVEKSVADNIIQSLKKAAGAELELISANRDKKSGFKTDDSGIEVKLYLSNAEKSPGAAVDFIIGKAGDNFTNTYISRPESNNTYSVKADLFNAFNQTEWRDKTIFSADKEKIAKIRFQYPKREFIIEKISSSAEDKNGEKDYWMGTSPYKFKISKEKIDKILEIMSNLTAVKIPEQKFEGTGLDKYNIIIQATGDGIDNTIMVGDDNGEKLYFAKRGDSDNIYLISKSQRDELEKNIWKLK